MTNLLTPVNSTPSGARMPCVVLVHNEWPLFEAVFRPFRIY